MKAWIIGIVAVVVIGGGGYLLLHKDSNKSDQPSQSSASQSSETSNESNNTPSQPAAATITYSDNGFSPATVTVKSGDTVAIKNTSSQPLQFDSDPHPDHTDDPELNVGIVNPGKEATFTVTTTGSHGYHNHLNSSDRGTIIVQ